MIGPNRHHRHHRRLARCRIPLVDKTQEGSNPLLDLVAAIQVNLIRPADRITDVLLVNVQCLIKFPEQKRFFHSLRI